MVKLIYVPQIIGNNRYTTNAIKIENTEEHTNCITFDYLNRLEGGILQVIHTGNINSITVSPKLIDGKIVIERYSSAKNTLKILVESFISAALSIMASFIIVFIEYILGANEIIQTISLWIVFIVTLIGSIFLQSKDFIPKNCRK